MLTTALAGHVCADLTPALLGAPRLDPGALVEVGPLAFSLGGCVANTAGALVDLGHPVTVHAGVGDDELGRLVRAGLRGPLVTPRLQLLDAATSYSVVVQPPGVDRVFWHHTGANAAFDGSGVDLTGPGGPVDLLHLGYPALLPALLVDGGAPLAGLLASARAQGTTTSVDLVVVDPGTDVGRLDWHALLARMTAETDVLSPSLDDLTSALGLPTPATAADAAALAEELADRLLGWGAAVVLLSDGERGALLRTAGADRLRAGGRALAPLAGTWADRRVHLPALAVPEAATTNGAGDASTAGLLHALARGATPEQAVRLASASAAAVVAGTRPTPARVVELDPSLAGLLAGPPAAQGAPAAPLLLPANQPADRFYRGGQRIADLRGDGVAAPRTPEDWVASATTVRGDPATGLTTLPDGRLLRDALAADPVAWLGPEHVDRWGADPMLLVKLLDAGQRLPVHAHPDDAFAAHHLGAAHGKAEAWHVLEAGVVHVGLRRDVTAEELASLVAEQDCEALLALLHAVPVAAGDSVSVPPGTLHAVGEGVLLLEVQQPEDLSILLEWRDFALDGAADGHLGLGFGTALAAVDRRALTSDDVARLVVRAADRGAPSGGFLRGLAPGTEHCFRLEEVVVDAPDGVPGADAVALDAGLAVLLGVEGAVRATGAGGATTVERGATALVAAAAGRVALTGRGRVLVARPPRP